MEEIKASLRLLIDLGGRLAPNNYLYLASAHREEGDLEAHLSVLREAYGKHPKNTFIRLGLARAYLIAGKSPQALKVLEEVDLSSYPKAAQLVLQALTALGRTTHGLSHDYLGKFARELEQCPYLTSAELLQLGEACKKLGHDRQALRVFEELVGKTDDNNQLARAYFHLGRHQEALSRQRAYLRSSDNPSSSDYQLLGDIHSKLGASAAARSAYQRALSLLKKRTTLSAR